MNIVSVEYKVAYVDDNMVVDDELIKKLPIIAEEQIRNEYWDADEFIAEGLRRFDEAIKEIDRLNRKSEG